MDFRAGLLTLALGAIAGAVEAQNFARVEEPEVPAVGPDVDLPSLYAFAVLQGGENEHVSVTSMDDTGDRAVLIRALLPPTP